MKSKELLAAGIVRDFRFRSKDDYLSYLRVLDGFRLYHVLESRLCEDGTVLARIVQQYNDTDTIELPQSNLEV